MSVTDDELTSFLVKDLPRVRMREIQQMIDTDEEFAARVEVNRWMIVALGGSWLDGETTPQSEAGHIRQLFTRHRRTVIVLLVLLTLTATATAAWIHLTAPLFSDDLTSGWFNSELWMPPPEGIEGGGVRAEKGYTRLVNRGYLRPRREFKEPIDIRLEWKWFQLGLNPLYADHLTIALRTSASPRTAHSYEVSDGLMVKLDAWSGLVRVLDAKTMDELAKSTERTPMPAEEWHNVRVTDDGETISVYIDGPLVDKEKKNRPVLQARISTVPAGSQIAIYNRELVSVPHESCIRKFSVRVLSSD